MENFLLLTVLGLIITLFTIQPDYKKYRIAYNGYSFGTIDKLFIFIISLELLSLIIISSLISYNSPDSSLLIINQTLNINQALNLTLPLINTYLIQINYKYLFYMDFLSILTVIFILLFFYMKLYTKKIRIWNKGNFLDKWDELFNKKEYTTLIQLMKDNYINIIKLEKYYDYDKLWMDIAESVLSGKKELTPSTNFDSSFLDSIEMRILDYTFITNLVKFDPYLGIRIITDEKVYSVFREDFAQLFFKELVLNRNSIFYREVLNTQSMDNNKYRISENNKIIHQILTDIQIADKNEIYRPIGRSIVYILQEQGKNDSDLYNEYDEHMMPSEDERFKDPIFMVVHFFDIMIREALYQKIEWHMFLHYYSYFVREICNNYQLTTNSNPNAEFPNTYSVILWQIFHNLINWIELIDKDAENINLKLDNIYCDLQNNNIIKNSICVLVECTYLLLESKNIPYDLKRYLVGNVLELYGELILSKHKNTQKYGEVLEDCLLNSPFRENTSQRFIISLINHMLTPNYSSTKSIVGLNRKFSELQVKINKKLP